MRLAAILGMLWATVSAAAPPFSFPYPIQASRLDNGLTVLRIPFASRGLVAFDTVVRVGARNETDAGKTGFAHFFEHVMFRGTPRFPGNERSDRLAMLGVLDNASTWDDITLFTCYGPNSALEALIDLEADRFQHLSYDEPAFRTEALAVLGEYHKSAVSPDLKLAEALLAKAFQRHPYRHTTLGYYEDIRRMPEQYAYSRQFFERWYTPDNTLLVIAGEFDDAKLMELIRRYYGPWKGRASNVPIPAEPPQREAQSARVNWTGPTLPRLVNAWHTPAATLDSPDAPLAQLLGAYLVGATSPLYRKVVLEEQWADFFDSDAAPRRDPGLFSVQAALKREAYRVPLQTALNAEIATLRSGKVDVGRLREIQSALRYGTLMELDTAEVLAERVGSYAGIYGAPDALERHLRHLSDATPAQLVAFARRHLVDSNRTIAGVWAVEPGTSGVKP